MAGGFRQEQGISVGLPVIQNRAAKGEQCFGPPSTPSRDLWVPSSLQRLECWDKPWFPHLVWLRDHTLLVGIQTRDPVC